MKLIAVLLFLLVLAAAEDCPQDLDVRCSDDLYKAKTVCENMARLTGIYDGIDLD